MAQFVNSAVLVVVVKARWAWLQDRLAGASVAGFRLLDGPYADLSAGWYKEACGGPRQRKRTWGDQCEHVPKNLVNPGC